ncbi:hypothetical protein ACNVED_14320 [Legionella sp. D16C41]|uniref:TackOD1 domain-containing metal-binding protein n=1 Tax=Legionella sp. D16C41 TaxID=3402688 RepID=UPI003AF6BFF3
MSDKKIIILSEDKTLDIAQTEPYSVQFITTLDEFSANECFLLGMQVNKLSSWTLLQQLRKLPNAKLIPLFYIGEIDERLSSLYDGLLDNRSIEIADQINKCITQISTVYNHAITYCEKLILNYLFTRKDYLLTGFIDYHVSSAIEYPLIRFLTPESQEQDGSSLLEAMAEDELIKPCAIKGEVQTCPYCHSIAVVGNDIIRCKACKSTLSKMALKEADDLSCPYCQGQLEPTTKPNEIHLPAPFYQRTLENPIICLDCKKQSTQTELISRKCFAYKITPEGENFVRGINLELSYLISEKANVQALVNLTSNLKIIPTVAELPKRGCFAVIIDLSLDWQNILKELRRQNYYHLTPIFYLGEFTAQPELILFDGPFNTNFLVVAAEINENMRSLHYNENYQAINHHEWRILSYLFTRPKNSLIPLLNYQLTDAFHYPVIDLFEQEEKIDIWEHLQGMATRSLLKQGKIINEVQSCLHCHAGLLNFTSNCPNCHSVDIREQQFIHCFTCGNIGPISEFMLRGQLRCSRCHVKLRHIGIDYDKPLEDKLCLNCTQSFFEYEVNVTCLVCKKQTLPQDLLTRKLYEYHLDRYGSNLVKGTEQRLFSNVPQLFKFVDFNAFMALVKWNVKMAKRFKNLSFSLLAVNILNQDDLMLQFGLIEVEKLLYDLFEGLRSIFREIDLCTKDEDQLIFFLPMTDENANTFIIKKIQNFLEKTWRKREPKIKIGLSYISSTEIIKLDLSEDLLLSELRGWVTYEQ